MGSEPATTSRSGADATIDWLKRISPFGFGASSQGNLYRAIDDNTAHAAIDAAWAAGVRYFDTAPFYGFGLSERRLGDALRGRERSSYLLSTKVGRLLRPADHARDKFGFCSPMPFDPVFDYSYDGVMRSFEASLQRLGLNRIDILYIHDIGALTHGDRHEALFKQAMDGGYRALASLRAQGAVSAIGLGVNEVEVCEASFAHADFDLFMLAGRYTLLNQDSLPFLDRCRARGTAVVGAGVFNSGILATGVGGAAAGHYDYDVAPDSVLARVAAIERVCIAHGVPLAVAALQFAAAHPAVACTVVGSSSASRIAATTELARLRIAPAFWADLRRDGLLPADAPIPPTPDGG